MKRIDIILSQAIKDDFIEYYTELCTAEKVKCKFTMIDNIMGQGNTNPKMGDAIWPQLNTMFIIFCDDNMPEKISKLMARLNKEYIGEGAASFISDAEELG